MKKKLFLFFLICLTNSIKTYANDKNSYKDLYVTTNLGISKTQNCHENFVNHLTKFKLGPNLGFAIGKKISNNSRLELEPLYFKNAKTISTINAKRLHVLSTLGNLYYDFPAIYNFNPYIGVGAGISKITNSSSSRFSYQTIIGTLYKVTDKVDLITDYRYLQTAKLKPIGSNVKNHSLNLGIKYNID